VFLSYSKLHKGYKYLDISMGRMYISCDIVFDETVFPFSSLHSNAGARLRDEINLLPLSLQPLNLQYHEGLELREPFDVNLANATKSAAESFLQNSYHNFHSDDESRNITNFGADSSDRPGAGTSSHPISASPAASGSPAASVDIDILLRVRAWESAVGPALDSDSLSRDRVVQWDSVPTTSRPRGAVSDARLSVCTSAEWHV
jgi:hypothetical protein